MTLLFDLARAGATSSSWRDRMFAGEKINSTEDRAVLHVALRNRSNRPILVDGKDVMPEVNAVLAKMRVFTESVRTRRVEGATPASAITDVVNIGIGGSDLGPVMATEALKPYWQARAARALRLQRRRHAPRRDAAGARRRRPTLFIVASQDLHDAGDADERAQRARVARRAARERGRTSPSTSSPCPPRPTEVKKFGIDPANMFAFWDWVGGRYSLW